jgi:uncharacterized damage-inducible protein DinB
MFTRIADFEAAWTYESGATAKLLAKLTDASLTQRVTPQNATLGWEAWHTALSVQEMCKRMGLKIEGPGHDAPVPAKASDITATYEKASKSLLEQMKGSWKDETLNVEDDMYGEKWKRGATLLVLLLHQAHHRGQVVVLMRQAGLPVTGIYGPAKEEWAAMGMHPPKV